MNPADEMAAKPDAAGFGGEPDKQLREAMYDRLLAIEKQRVGHQGNPVEQDDLRPGFTSRLEVEASEHKAIHDRLAAIENQTKRRGSRGFTGYLVAVLIGVATTLAWQSYGDAGKQVIATKAPELGWSPEARKMITSWVPVGWTKPPAGSEKQVVPVAQTAPQNVAPKSAYYRFPRPRAAAADNAEPDHAHRGSRPDDACDRQAGVRRRGTNHEDARASAATPRCPSAQAQASAAVLASAGDAAQISGTKTTASSIKWSLAD